MATRRSPRGFLLMAFAMAFFAGIGGAAAQGLGGDAGARADVCAKTALKATASFAASRLKVAGGCTDALLSCLETKADGAKRDTCVAKRTAKCRDAFGKLAAGAAKLEAAIGKKCADVGITDLLAGSGLGFTALAGECSAALGRPLATFADLTACLALRQSCHADALLGAEAPRAKALLRTVGALAGITDPAPCLPDAGGGDAAVAERATLGKAVDKCARGIRKAASGFAAKKLKALGGCVSALFACEQRAADPSACRTKAAGGCTKAFAAIATAESKVGPAITKACTAVPLATVLAPEGLHATALGGDCTQLGVPSLATLDTLGSCLLRQHACRIETMIAGIAPRAAALLAGAGFTLQSGFCPDAPVFATPTPGATAQKTATPKPTPTPGAGDCGNGIVDGANEICDGAALAGATCGSLGFAGGTLACAPSCAGFDSTGCTLPASPPADPATVAPEADPTKVTDFASGMSFLFLGDPPTQYGVVAGTIDPVAAAVIRGRVLDAAGAPLAGVEIRILDHPELGATQSRADGRFDLVVNGGGLLTVTYAKDGFLSAQRQLPVPWQQFAAPPDVRLSELDLQATAVDLASMNGIVVARGSEQTDADGSRQATLLVKPGTAAEMLLPDGSTQPITQLTLRATEYTVVSAGPARMPATLPPTSGYTYAVEYSIDEARAAGAPMVAFDQPIPTYVENFPGFPAGTIVPAGFYDYTKGAWVAAPNGIVIAVVGITADLADLDVTGDGIADGGSALGALGIDDAERATLAGLYAPGASLWRVPVDHFSAWDYNWPFGPPGDATPPDESGANAQSDDEPIDGSCEEAGSVIECENQVLGEDVALAGTPYSLHYRSDRVPGRVDAVDVQLSGSSVPASLLGITLRATVAGQTTTQNFGPGPNQSVRLTWNGTDAYGRPVQGGQRATGTIDYVYPAVYKAPGEFAQSFAAFGGVSLAANRSAATIAASMPFDVTLREGITDARGLGLGGWTLGVHHFYDPVTKVLHLGTGGRRRAESVARVIETVLQSPAQFGNGTIASFTFAPDGSMYVARFDERIRQRAPDGTETVVAGTGQPVDPFNDPTFGDGGPATQARLISAPDKLEIGADGSIYFSDNHVIRRVRPDGIMQRMAGKYFFDGQQCSGENGTPDGAVALESRLCIDDFEVGPDGTIYLGEFFDGTNNYRVRRVADDGTLVTIFGGGGQCDLFFGGTCGDDGPAVVAKIHLGNHRMTLGPDGTLFFQDANRIRKITPDGIVSHFAGAVNQFGAGNGFDGDGFPAGPGTRFCGPFSIAFAANGDMLVGDIANNRIRRIAAADRVVSTIAGSGATCTDFNVGSTGDSGPALQALLSNPRQLAVAPNGDIFTLAGTPSRIRRIGPPLPGFTAADILVASEDGRSLYAFDPNGKHLGTFDTLTGALRRQFVYDGDGRLEQIVEKTGGTDNVTTIQRNGGGHPTAIVGPFGKTTTLAVDGNGFLASIANPAGETRTIVSTATGLLTSYTEPGNRTSTFTYDEAGRLLKDEDPGPGSTTLAKSGPPDAFTVTVTSALGRVTSHAVEQLPSGVVQRTITAPDGTANVVAENPDAASRESTGSTGAVMTQIAGPDPRFGMEAPVATSVSLEFPSELTAATTNARTATVSNPFDPLSLVTLTESSTVAGNTATTVYTAATRTFLTTTPLGRTRSLALDELGRPVTLSASGGIATTAGYDARGRLAQITTGSGDAARTFTFTYDATHGLPLTVTDPLDRTATMARDALGRMTSKTLPGGDVIGLGFNAAGDFASLTPPGRPAHQFGYDARGLLTAITPPTVPGTGATTFAYDDDGVLTTVTRPDETVTFAYAASGRPSSVALSVQSGPSATYTFAYDAATGLVTSVTGPGGAVNTYAYDGPLLTDVTWAGPVTGTLSVAHDARLAVATETVTTTSGPSAVAFTHDADDHLVAAGDLAITRDAATGLPTATALGVVTDASAYDGFGELLEYEAAANGTAIYAETFTYDKLGRIVTKTETIGGATDTLAYDYDAEGQLIEVRRDGDTVETYDYDANGNRVAATVGIGSVTATYDDQDRLLTYGTTTFTHSASGRVATRTNASGTTAYTYDAAGNLLAVALPDGTDVTYTLDATFRRVARNVDGVPAGRFLWSGNRPIAELDAAGALVSRFVYAGGPAPAYLVRNGVAHRIVVDHVGSVRLVVNAATGAIAQRLDYDSFGRVTQDTNPGFQPFGFAGGFYDPATKLVRFDVRDYDAVTGRWTAKDPIGFAGLDTNLYRYAANDPVNLTDPDGRTVAEIVTGIAAGIWDVLHFPVSLANAGQNLSNLITEAITGVPQPVIPDPNPIVSVMEGVNGLAEQIFDAEPIIDTDSTAFEVSRICTNVAVDLPVGVVGLLRGGIRGAAKGGIRPAMQAAGKTGKNVGRTADEGYRPLVSAEAAKVERLNAENARRIADREARQAAQQAAESRRLELVRPEGGGAGTRGTNKPAGGLGTGS